MNCPLCNEDGAVPLLISIACLNPLCSNYCPLQETTSDVIDFNNDPKNYPHNDDSDKFLGTCHLYGKNTPYDLYISSDHTIVKYRFGAGKNQVVSEWILDVPDNLTTSPAGIIEAYDRAVRKGFIVDKR